MNDLKAAAKAISAELAGDAAAEASLAQLNREAVAPVPAPAARHRPARAAAKARPAQALAA